MTGTSHANRECKIVFFLDAVRYDYLNPRDTPFMYKMAKKGISGPLSTILGFDGIAATIFTGTYPDVHGVWTQHILARCNSPYDWFGPYSFLPEVIDRKIRGTSFAEKAFRYLILRASLFRSRMTFCPGVNKVPFSNLSKFDFAMKRLLYEENAFGSIPTLFDMLRKNGITFSIADHSIFGSDQNVVKKILKMRRSSEVVYVRLMDLDETIHSHGVYSLERLRGLKNLDNAVHFIVSCLEHDGSDPSVVLFADHGMMDVTRYVDVITQVRRSGLVEGKDFDVFLDSTMARFWAESSILTKITEILSNLGFGRILTNFDLERYHAPKLQCYGDLIYLADPGVVILPNYYQGYDKIKGMHGYDPFTSEMNTIFIIYHKGIKHGRIYNAKIIDILPTILDMLEIPKPQHCLGSSKLCY